MGRWFKGQLRRDFISDQMFPMNRFATDPPESQCPDNPAKNLTIDYFPQPLDQFNSTDKRAWKQVNRNFKLKTNVKEGMIGLVSSFVEYRKI